MEPALGREAFDGHDLAAAALDAQHQARQHRDGRPAARRRRRTRRARTRAWCRRGSDPHAAPRAASCTASNATSCGSPLTVSAICVFCTAVLQSSDGVVREHRGNRFAGQRTVGTKPLDGPVQRAEEGAGRHRRIGRRELAAPDARRDQRPDSTLVAIAPCHHGRPQPAGERVELEVHGRSLDLVDHAEHVLGRKRAQPPGDRPFRARRRSRPRPGADRA